MLGICYGLQWLTQALGGEVLPADGSGGEYGRTEMTTGSDSPIFAGIPAQSTVWMSHGDKVSRLPKGFEILASSDPCPVAAAADPIGVEPRSEMLNAGRLLESEGRPALRVCSWC